ncbi:MAG: lysine biosynthesis protein LysX [Thaumarchaeota archaeon]|nr:lysine biosynthesis protein LysX [Nitrososphaerota archaeon]
MAKRLALIYDRIRWEEKVLVKEAKAKGFSVNSIDAKNMLIDIFKDRIKAAYGEIVLQRCISYYRGLHATAYLESKGLKVVNSLHVSTVCGNKFLTSLALQQAGIPTPKTFLAFTPDAAMQVLQELKYPAVLKPVTGSWGRSVAPLKDPETARAILEIKEDTPGALNQIYYIQEMVKRPPRDIRTIVIGDELITAVYRHAPPDDWRTNVALGGKTTLCPVTNELEDVMLKAARAVGGGVLGVDAMESPNGVVVHEVNNTVEFKGAAVVSEANIPRAIVKYLVELVKR